MSASQQVRNRATSELVTGFDHVDEQPLRRELAGVYAPGGRELAGAFPPGGRERRDNGMPLPSPVAAEADVEADAEADAALRRGTAGVARRRAMTASGGRKRRGKKSRKSRKGRKGKKSRKNKRRTKRR